MLEFDAGTRTRITAAMTLDFDPTGSTIELKIGSTWYDAVWLETPVECSNGEWKQEAQTVLYFAGPDVESPNGAIVLAATRYRTKTSVDSGGTIIVHDSSQIQVA